MGQLTRVLGIPSDYQFAAEHWRPVTRAQALAINPYYTTQLAEAAYLYTCDCLDAGGRCTAHDVRPSVCRGYPWYGMISRDLRWADPDCGYLVDWVYEVAVRRPES